jgi:outer membrane protein assembly factor BamB
LVGATLLNDPDDDHAGIGRIFQFDADLNEKGVLWVEGTTHLVYGLTFAPDGILRAFDPWEWLVIQIAPSGQQLPNRHFADRAFSMVHFAPDGTLYFTESLGDDCQPEPLTTRHKPLPGHATKLGDGNLYQFTADGTLLRTLDTDYHGGMSGSMALTHSVLSADGQRLIYVSETGPRLMQFDIESGRQLDDLQAFDKNSGEMFFDIATTTDGRLLVCRGDRLVAMNMQGHELHTYSMAGFGWSIVEAARSDPFAYVGNWFTGELVKLDLDNGEVCASTMVAEKCMAGVVQNIFGF